MSKLKDYIQLHVNILLFSLTSVFSKAASVQYNKHGLSSPLLYLFLFLMVANCGIYAITWQQVIMYVVGLLLIYLAIEKNYEPALLLPMGFGAILVNLPASGVLNQFMEGAGETHGIIQWLFESGIEASEAFPLLLFIGIGAMIDFGPLLSNPKMFLFGAASQFGIFFTIFMASLLGFDIKDAASIGIIGAADGPTSILVSQVLKSNYIGAIAVAAYSYMALVPIIQPPIMKLFTTKKERAIKMQNLRPVSKLERILFPVVVTIVVCTLLPTTAPLVGMLMLGNLFRESGVVRQLQETASNALMYIVVILLGTSVGASTSAESFLNMSTIKIVILGLIAFMVGTAAGVLFGKLLCFFTKGKINPLIGSAGVSAVPMAARVSQKVGAEEDPTNFLLMHAMGPNVAGVIGTAVAAGCFMAIFGI